MTSTATINDTPKLPSLPQEVLDIILVHVNGDICILKQVALVNKHFNDWAKTAAVKSWPTLREELRQGGKRICEGCMRFLPVKQWVEVAPRCWLYQTECVTCRIRELVQIMYSQESFDGYVTHVLRTSPSLRQCLCCRGDFGPKQRSVLQEKMGIEKVFCEHCEQLILYESGRTQRLALQCGQRYVESLDRIGYNVVSGITKRVDNRTGEGLVKGWWSRAAGILGGLGRAP